MTTEQATVTEQATLTEPAVDTTKLRKVSMVHARKASELPLGCFIALYSPTRLYYKGDLVHTNVVELPEGQYTRGIVIGDFTYAKQSCYENTSESAQARSGMAIIHIYHRPSGKLVGKVKVVDGKARVIRC